MAEALPSGATLSYNNDCTQTATGWNYKLMVSTTSTCSGGTTAMAPCTGASCADAICRTGANLVAVLNCGSDTPLEVSAPAPSPASGGVGAVKFYPSCADKSVTLAAFPICTYCKHSANVGGPAVSQVGLCRAEYFCLSMLSLSASLLFCSWRLRNASC
ncbi:MAG: hypothetical protein EOO65_02905 [Methanosarcinales archaeon]|nr:MAG: hypothetical protein EOO65_02905 [Methanosarcinales archaeon]